MSLIRADDPRVENATKEYDFFDPRYRGEDEMELVGCLRERDVAFKSQKTKQWEFFTDELVRTASEDVAMFTSYWEIPEEDRDPEVATTGDDALLIPVQTDPPNHTWYRRALNPLFTRDRMHAMEQDLRQFSTQLLDPLVGRTSFDFHDEFATPFPSMTFCRLMGWPIEDYPKLMEWRDIYMYFSSPSLAERLGIPESDREPSGRAKQSVVRELTKQTAEEMHGYLKGLFDDRRREPRDDLMTALTQLKVDNDTRRLTEAELLGMGFNFFLAGLDTVSATLSLIVENFAQRPDDRRAFIALMEDDRAVGVAISELTRFHAIVRTQRQVQQDCEFHGLDLKRNDLINFDVASACRDPAKFEDADKLRFDRDPNPHLGFGHGRHRCLGIHLGALELKVALQEFHRRFPNYALDPENPPERGPGITRGMFSLPLLIG